jgi:hypothetical protein
VQGQSVMVRVVAYGKRRSVREPITPTWSTWSRTYRGDGVGLVAHGDGGGLRAVGGVGSDDVGGDGHVGAPGGSARNGSGDNSGGSELHFDGIRINSKSC